MTTVTEKYKQLQSEFRDFLVSVCRAVDYPVPTCAEDFADALNTLPNQLEAVHPMHVLHEAWLAVHACRFKMDDAAANGPDSFYNGVLHAERALAFVASNYGVHPHTLRNMELPPATQRSECVS